MSMESLNHTRSKLSNETLAMLRRRGKNITRFFLIFTIFLIIIIAAIFIHLVHSFSSQKTFQRPSEITNPNLSLPYSLQATVKQIEDAISSIDQSVSGDHQVTDANALSALKKCSKLLRESLSQIWYVFKYERNLEQSEIMKIIAMAEEKVFSCQSNLKKGELSVARRTEMVQVYLRTSAGLAERIRRGQAGTVFIVEYLSIVLLGSTVLLVIGFIFWKVHRFA